MYTQFAISFTDRLFFLFYTLAFTVFFPISRPCTPDVTLCTTTTTTNYDGDDDNDYNNNCIGPGRCTYAPTVSRNFGSATAVTAPWPAQQRRSCRCSCCCYCSVVQLFFPEHFPIFPVRPIDTDTTRWPRNCVTFTSSPPPPQYILPINTIAVKTNSNYKRG